MSELRKDPVIGRWVIISTERGRRPSDFEITSETSKGGFCPFCTGHEYTTPHEIYAVRKPGSPPDSPDWSLRVVPNKFPALQIEGKLHRRPDGIYDKMNGIGAHEVIIETPLHDLALADMDIQKVQSIFIAYKERILDLQKDQRFGYAMIFKNHGRAAGATLLHTHSQLIAMPIIPKRVSEELRGAKSYFNNKERCVFCDILEQELEDPVRVIDQNDEFVAIAPYAPRFPFETWILPKRHQAFFERTSDNHFIELAKVLSSFLKRMNVVLESPPYNYLIHNSPFAYKEVETYHWHLEIMPKSTRVAGFEWGTGFYINPTPPEEAAKFLREVEID
jgi:UDPglucose--hexose-1-phosphate uridylyltransferase